MLKLVTARSPPNCDDFPYLIIYYMYCIHHSVHAHVLTLTAVRVVFLTAYYNEGFSVT